MLFITVGLQHTALASHSMGVDISYTNVGQDSFIITLNFYRDCSSSTTAPTVATIDYRSINCAFTGTIDLPLTPMILPQNIPNGSEVSALCGNSISNSTCNGGTLPGVQQYQYSALVVLPARCTDWVFSYDLCCRNAGTAPTNLNGAASYDIYAEASLNNTIFPQDNSPIFTNRPVPYFCYLDSIQYNHGSIDVDGDSLVYTLINPLGGPGTPVPYNAPYSPTNPLACNGPFVFDPATGQMTFVPSNAQTAVITILVQEYRNGVLIGSTMRDIQINILGNPVCVPPYGQVRTRGIDSSSVTGGVNLGNYTLQVCPGATLNFNISFGGDSVYLSSNASQALPGATFNVSTVHSNGSVPDSVLGQFSWTPSALDTGTKVFSIQYGVRACPIDRTSSRTITINVLKGTSAGPDKIYCTAGLPVQLFAVGGTQFTWSPATGLSDPNIRNPLASPTVTTDYVVTSNLQGQCHNSDTVQVKVVPNFILSISPQNGNLNLCRNALVGLSVTADSTYGPYTYSWTPAVGLVDSAGNIDSTHSSVFARPQGNTTYTVYVTSDTGCTIKDSVNIILTNQGPKVVIDADKNQVCNGDTIHLNASVYPVSCGASTGSGSCNATHPPVPVTYGTGTTVTAITPFGGSNKAYRYQALYRKADLVAAGVNAGTIVRMRFNVNTHGSTTIYKNFTIRLGCVTTAQLSRNNWENASTQVYFSSSQLINTGLNTFTLNQPYDWDGYSNLVMEVCFGDGTATSGGDDQLLSTSVSYDAVMAAGSATASSGCALPATAIANNQVVRTLPNVTFFFCAATVPSYTYSWAPASGLSTTVLPNTVATVTQPITYILTVADSLCTGNDLIRLFPDSTSLFMPNDTALCSLAPTDSLHFHVGVGGTPAAQCGTNGNTCSGPLAETKVGNGTATNIDFDYPSAYGNYYGSAMQQFLYTAADLRAAGVQPGRVKELAFYITDLAGTLSPYPGYTISEKCTNVNQLTVGQPETGLSVVFTPKSVTPTVGINNFVLDNAFDWDGVSNIVLQICFDNTALYPFSYSSNAYTSYTTTGYMSSTYYADDASGQCSPSSLALVTGGNFFRPNTRFRVCSAQAPATISWTPTTGRNNPHSFDVSVHPTGTTTYKVSVVTSQGCTKTDSVTVTVGTLAHTISRDTTICSGGNGAHLLVTGGNRYAWSPATGLSCTTCPNPIATPATTTRYHVTITDSTIGCTVVDSVNVAIISGPTPPFGNDTSICFTDSVILHAGAGGTSYVWSVPTAHDSILVVRTGGTYSVTITSATGCVTSDTITINQRTTLPVNLGNDTALCIGSSLTLDASQLFAHYAWSTSATDTLETVTVNTTNNYSVTVTDPNGCLSSDTIHVAFNPVPVVNLGNDTTLCFADSLRLNAYNGPFFDYMWSTGETTGNITVTSATQQPVWVSISGGGALCSATDTINITFRAPVVVSAGNDTAVCFGQSVTFDAGQGFNSYAWNTTPVSNTQSITVSAAGNYVVTVTDNIGCRGIDTVVLTINSTAVTIAASPSRSACVGDTVTLTANIAQPTGAVYQWSTGETTQSIRVSATGNYCVTVTPATGCPGTACDSVTFNALPVVNLGPDTLLCAGVGYLVNAGPQPAGSTYLWSDNSTAATHNFTQAGTVWVDVTSAAGCTTRDSLVITYRPAPAVNAGNDTTVCLGKTVTFTASPGYNSYTWTLNGVTVGNTASVTVTAPGFYAVAVTNASGCIGHDTVILANINAAINIGPDTIPTCQNASVTLDAGAGYSVYSWTTPAGNATTETVNTANGGVYSVTVTDANGCTASDAAFITVRPAAAPALGNDTSLCPGAAYTLYPGAFDVYNWSDGSHNSTLTITAAGTYTVDVVDSFGCHGIDTAVIGYYPTPTQPASDNQALCRNATDTLHAPAGYNSYLWSNGTTDSTLVVTTPGTYSLTVNDSNGCPVVIRDTVADGTIRLTAGADPSPVNAGQTATLSPQLTTSGHYSFVWTPGGSLNDSTLRNPLANPTTTTTYTVLVTDSQTHCFDTSSVTLEVLNQGYFVFPDAFTPNGDGSNDYFEIVTTGSNVVLKEFNIYNRFGTRVHSQPTPWNGEVGGTPQPTDTYVFTARVEVTDASGTHSYTYNVAFTLIR